MMPPLKFMPDIFKNDTADERQRSQKVLLVALEALAQMNSLYLLWNPQTPRLYDTSVVYRADPPYEEWYWTIPTILENGWGDCKKLACYRVAELRTLDGEPADPLITWRWDDKGYYGKPGWIFHALVQRADGQIEDPSKIKGMDLHLPSAPVDTCPKCGQITSVKKPERLASVGRLPQVKSLRRWRVQ